LEIGEKTTDEVSITPRSEKGEQKFDLAIFKNDHGSEVGVVMSGVVDFITL
jgi:hypothetical protein